MKEGLAAATRHHTLPLAGLGAAVELAKEPEVLARAGIQQERRDLMGGHAASEFVAETGHGPGPRHAKRVEIASVGEPHGQIKVTAFVP